MQQLLIRLVFQCWVISYCRTALYVLWLLLLNHQEMIFLDISHRTTLSLLLLSFCSSQPLPYTYLSTSSSTHSITSLILDNVVRKHECYPGCSGVDKPINRTSAQLWRSGSRCHHENFWNCGEPSVAVTSRVIRDCGPSNRATANQSVVSTDQWSAQAT